MYSQTLMNLANNMAFKKMSAMSFEEKYPIENIKRTVFKVEEMIENDIIPFHQSISNEKQILDIITKKYYRN
jgi:hypothetical protein